MEIKRILNRKVNYGAEISGEGFAAFFRGTTGFLSQQNQFGRPKGQQVSVRNEGEAGVTVTVEATERLSPSEKREFTIEGKKITVTANGSQKITFNGKVVSDASV